MKRFSTKYPGVFYREADRIGGKGLERIYYIVFKKDGKVIEEKVGRQFVDDMSPARAAGIRAERIEGKRQSRKEIREKQKEKVWTINALWDSYCDSNPDNKSLVHDKGKFNLHLKGGLGTKQPGNLAPLDVDRLRLNLQKAGKKTQAARVLEILRRTINYGVERGLIDPLKFKIEVPKLNNETTEDLTQEQLKALMGALDADEDQTAANVMRIALVTGMRRSEILELRWEDIDYDRGFIRLVDPKGGKDQTIPLNAAALAIFDSIHPLDGNPYVFPGKKKGTHLTDCRKAFDRIRKAAGVPKGFRPLHGLRHTFASMLASSGQVDMYTLQKLMTHKSPLMTQRYAHLRDDTLKRASNLAGDIINQAMGGIKEESQGKVVPLKK